MIIDARSRIVGGMTVGSCVAMITRVARCRWRRMTLLTDWVRRAESLLMRYLCASSNTASEDKGGQNSGRDRTFQTHRRSFRTPFAIE